MNSDLSRRVLDSMRCGVVTVDARGILTTINDTAASWLGVNSSSALGCDCREVFVHCPAMSHLLIDALERGTLPDRAELELDIKGEHRILIGFSLSRISGDKGETLGSAMFFKDLTLVEEERERQALRNRLASLGEVAAQLAHEIRNRLGGIRVFVGLARRRMAHDADGEAFLDRAEAEVVEANAKMTQMLDFVRPIKLDVVPTNLELICREALDGALARYPDKKILVEWEENKNLPLALIDPLRIRDALTNIFSNAIEACSLTNAAKGTIRVSFSAENAPLLLISPFASALPGLKGYGETQGARLRINISDSGPGINQDVLRRIFQPFYTTKEDGSGLGIPIAQKILDAHAGALDVEPGLGAGATFIVRVPADGPAPGSDIKNHGANHA